MKGNAYGTLLKAKAFISRLIRFVVDGLNPVPYGYIMPPNVMGS